MGRGSIEALLVLTAMGLAFGVEPSPELGLLLQLSGLGGLAGILYTLVRHSRNSEVDRWFETALFTLEDSSPAPCSLGSER